MKLDEFNYYFKMRSAKDVALTLGVIYNDLGYSKIDKNKVFQIYGLISEDLKDESYLNIITQKVEDLNNTQKDNLLLKCEQLQIKWENYKKEYYKIISNIFNINIDCNVTANTYCYLHILPINEVDLKDNIIYLDGSKRIEDIFKYFIIMLTKAILINRWNDFNNWNFNKEFDYKNKVWLFAEIAIDSIFSYSDLSVICNEPSYKFFYNLKINDKNMMEHFKQEYKNNSLDEFFTLVYMYVHENYKKLVQFKNYLY